MGDRERAIRRRAKRARRAARDKGGGAAAAEARWAPPVMLDEEGERAWAAGERAAGRAEMSEAIADYLDHIHDDLAAILAHLGITRPECEPWMPEPDEVSPDEP